LHLVFIEIIFFDVVSRPRASLGIAFDLMSKIKADYDDDDLLETFPRDALLPSTEVLLYRM